MLTLLASLIVILILSGITIQLIGNFILITKLSPKTKLIDIGFSLAMTGIGLAIIVILLLNLLT